MESIEGENESHVGSCRDEGRYSIAISRRQTFCLPSRKTGTLGLFVFTCASEIQLGAGETCLVLRRFDLPAPRRKDP